MSDIFNGLGSAYIWIALPIKTSDVKCDLAQLQIREAGLFHKLVDYKICAIDDTWSGLLFERK